MTRSAPHVGHVARLFGSILAVGSVLSGPVLSAPAPALAQAPPAAVVPLASSAAGPAPGESQGTWRVSETAERRYEVSWTSAERLPVTSDRPTIAGPGLTVGPSTLARDGHTVTAQVTSATEPDPATLDVVLSGDRLDEPGLDPRAPGVAAVPAAPPRASLDGPDPATLGPFPVTTSDYRLDPIKVARMRTPVEMVGHVVEPAADAVTGPRPLVLFLHGRHEACYDTRGSGRLTATWPCPPPFAEVPSHLGYDYVQRVLASQGYTTVSVRTNGINAQDGLLDDGGSEARATLVEAHLKHWVGLAAGHQVDLGQVVLVGHSRGGEGVDRAATEIPLAAPYRIVGQVLVAPVDFAAHSAPYIPTVTVLPYCDGDVYDLQGQRYTDTGRDLDAADTALKSSVLVMGANHNYFNTEWTPGIATAPADDDWYGDPGKLCGAEHPSRLRPAVQRDVATTYVTAAVRLFTGDDAFLPLFDGSRVTVPSLQGVDVRSHAIGGGRDLRRPGVDATPTAPGGGADTRICTGRTADPSSVGSCGRGITRQVVPHWNGAGDNAPARRFLEMAWQRSGATGGLRFDRPLDLAADRLELRTIVDPRVGAVRFGVRLTDGAGRQATVTPTGGSRLDPLPSASYVTKLWAQAVHVDASTAAGVDLNDIRSVELVADSDRGRVWIVDLAAAPSALAAVPATRLPRVEIGRLVVDEGNGRVASRTARLPFTITGTVSAPARIAVVTTGEGRGTRHRLGVDIGPGQTSGSIPIEYRSGNRIDDRDQLTQVQAYPTRGIATASYVGQLTVRDDDPDAVVRVRARRDRVSEGAPIVLRVSTHQRTGYPIAAYLEVVTGPGADLRGTDVPAAWLREHSTWGTPEHPVRDRRLTLAKLGVSLRDEIPAGPGTLDLTIPTRRDHRREGPERLTVRFHFDDGRTVRRTVTVLDAP